MALAGDQTARPVLALTDYPWLPTGTAAPRGSSEGVFSARERLAVISNVRMLEAV